MNINSTDMILILYPILMSVAIVILIKPDAGIGVKDAWTKSDPEIRRKLSKPYACALLSASILSLTLSIAFADVQARLNMAFICLLVLMPLNMFFTLYSRNLYETKHIWESSQEKGIIAEKLSSYRDSMDAFLGAYEKKCSKILAACIFLFLGLNFLLYFLTIAPLNNREIATAFDPFYKVSQTMPANCFFFLCLIGQGIVAMALAGLYFALQKAVGAEKHLKTGIRLNAKLFCGAVLLSSALFCALYGNSIVSSNSFETPFPVRSHMQDFMYIFAALTLGYAINAAICIADAILLKGSGERIKNILSL